MNREKILEEMEQFYRMNIANPYYGTVTEEELKEDVRGMFAIVEKYFKTNSEIEALTAQRLNDLLGMEQRTRDAQWHELNKKIEVAKNTLEIIATHNLYKSANNIAKHALKEIEGVK